jgi:hypothetical protein
MDQVENPFPQKSSKKWIFIGAIISVLIVASIIFYPWAKGELELFIVRGEFSLSNHPELGIVPQQLDLSKINIQDYPQFSYYGINFSVPWKDTPTIVTSKDGFATQLKFPGGQFITILASGTYDGVASNSIAESQSSGLSANQIKSVYGNIFSSDYSYMNFVLNDTPSESQDSNAVAQAFILPLKYVAWALVGGKPDSIYSFSTPTVQGFELVGKSTSTDEIYRTNFLFNLRGGGINDFVVGGATQDEANIVLASIELK